MVWGNVKTVRLANFRSGHHRCSAAAEAGLARAAESPELCFAFLPHTGLSP